MKKKIITIALGMALILTGCGADKDTASGHGAIDVSLSQEDEAKQQRAEDVKTAAAVANAVELALTNKDVLDQIQELGACTFDIKEPPEAKNGEEAGILFGNATEGDLDQRLNLLTDETGRNLAKQSPQIKYHDQNWNPTIWRIWVKEDRTVEIALVDTSKEGESGICVLYPTADPAYE